MYQQNSQNRNHGDHSYPSGERSHRPHADDTYEYFFSGSGFGEERPRKSRSDRSTIRLLSALLILLLAFGAGYGGALMARREETPTMQPATDEAGGHAQAITPNEDTFHATPEDFLIKADPTASPFGSAGENVFAISDVVKMVADTVVVIDTTITTETSLGSSTSSSSGSGVIISDDGYILTCNHVIEGASRVTVTLNDGAQYEAALVGRDQSTDLAVLKIEPTDPLVYAKQGCSADLISGEYVVAIGNPLGTLGGSVTKGIISATERRIRMSDGTIMTLLQTDAAINSGNSGGGLFNLKGELIGIVNAKYSATGVEGLGFAIPVDTAYRVELDIIRYGFVRGVIDHGISTVDVTESNLRSYYYYYKISEIGLYVTESKYCTDLQNKDRILTVNGVSVNTEAEMWSVLSQCSVGDEVLITASRAGKTFTTSLILREYIPEGVEGFSAD